MLRCLMLNDSSDQTLPDDVDIGGCVLRSTLGHLNDQTVVELETIAWRI